MPKCAKAMHLRCHYCKGSACTDTLPAPCPQCGALLAKVLTGQETPEEMRELAAKALGAAALTLDVAEFWLAG